MRDAPLGQRKLNRDTLSTVEQPAARRTYSYSGEVRIALCRGCVSMVQAAQSGKGVNRVSQSRTARDGSTLRCIFRQPQVCPVLVVIAHILGKQPFQVPFVQNDDVVQQVLPATPHPTLGNSVLPRTAKGGAHRLAAHGFGRRRYFLAKFRVAVEEQEPVCRRVRPRFPQLLYDPKSARISRDVAAKNPAPVVADNKKAIQHSKRERGHREEVHGGNGLTMISQEREPGLDGIGSSWSASKPARDG